MRISDWSSDVCSSDLTWTSPTGSSPASGSHDGSDLLEKAAAQLRDYFADNRHSFDLPLQPRGTEFHCAVWREMLAIPYGSTKSYGDLATATGAIPRAVGTACEIGRAHV